MGFDGEPSGSRQKLALATPALGPEEEQAALEVLRSGALVSGPRVEAFEQAFATAHGAAHGVATSSGATALSALLLAHGIGPGDEVIVPSFSFFATAACVLGVGATPVFADIEPVTYCLSAAAAEAAVTPRTRAVMPVHLFGLAADMTAFERLASRHALLLLEDAAQAHGASYGERRVGSFGTAAFSFHASKNMTTLEGGMVLTSDAALARRLRQLRNHGRERGGLHELAGSNFRMTELGAAIGLIQLGRLPGLNARRRANARGLTARLKGVTPPHEPPGRQHVYQQYTLRLPVGVDRDAIIASLERHGIETRAYYGVPIHAQPALAGRPQTRTHDLSETERAAREVLSVPVHPGLREADLEHVAARVNAEVLRFG